ncbi:tetrahydrocannabinolic acid synthase-like [Momordica charantia]|uniref:Tetrahydrocannabinolic acid synthase-like n=1 Tax=Momordica charantia TaxID=3673 RepID=A0A6J1CN68_MOMCH|nr:tetrahydrocannabinolic acid synthase-like [Momordica charantia]
MNYPSPLISLSLAFIFLSSSSLWASAFPNKHESFLQCLLDHSLEYSNYSISKVIHTPINSSYSSVLDFSIRNLRFSTVETPKPLLIVTPSHVSHIQAAVICSKSYGFQIRTRSGGHDFEGLSYVAHLPFIIVDLINLRSISIDIKDNTAWVQSGATLGELYYSIAQKSRTLAFPAGICPTVGVGGHFSGGGYGLLLRKYGLAADNVIDAYLVDASGKFHNRESMGEDLFWAIRGGGGGSFGIVVAWKVKLVPVPATVTLCSANRTLEEGAVKITHRWQYVANKLDENLFLGILWLGGKITSQEGGKTNPVATFFSLFLGKADELLSILNTKFPELDLAKKDCIETSWIESTVLMGVGFPTELTLEALLSRTPLTNTSSKIKSDYVKEPMSEAVVQGIWKRLDSQDIEGGNIIFVPYGGRMSQISESETPFSHRAGYLYKIGYIAGWEEQGIDAEKRHLRWIRELYDYMTPFVSKSPRAAYANYRDLDIGSNNKFGKTSYKQASVWGLKYFGNNFNRLVHVKTKVDPYDFFRHEQSIPAL